MTKSLTVAALAAFMLAIAGCAGDPPQQKSSDALAAPSDNTGLYGHWMVPISFPD